MKFSTKLVSGMKRMRLASTRFRKICFFAVIILINTSLPGYGQQSTRQPSWWFGLGGGANLNLYNGSTSSLNPDVTASPSFSKGHGFGGNLMGLIEFHKPGSMWGFMLLQGADDRSAEFKESGNEFKANIAYYTIEPSITIAPPRSNLYFHIGPRFGFLWTTTFKYTRPNMPDYPNENDPEAHAYIRNLRKNPISMQVGIGYNIMFSPRTASTQIALSPFVTYLPSLGRNIRTIESLKLNTIRAGIILKAGRASQK